MWFRRPARAGWSPRTTSPRSRAPSTSWRATPRAGGAPRPPAPSCGAASSPPPWRSGSRRCTGRRSMRRSLSWGAQALAALVVGVMVWRAIARNWDEFRSLHVTLALKPGWIALSVLVVFLTYAIQIESWRRILAGWAQPLAYARAARIWLLVNLGRYVPGKIWSVAGLIVLAQRAGVEAWAAGASAFAIQALGLSPEFRPLPLAAVAESAGLTLASWVTYGVAFWLLARGLGLPGALPLTTATGVFALGYIVGLLALFAPGGIGVRELVFVGLLAPSLGSGGAVALSVGSRVLLTLCEAVAPLGMLLITGRTKEDVGVR